MTSSSARVLAFPQPDSTEPALPVGTPSAFGTEPAVPDTLAPRGGYRGSASSRWVGLAGTLGVYGVAAGLLLLTFTVHYAAPPPPPALTVVDTQPPAAPPQTPPKPKDAPKPVERKPTPPQPIKTVPVPEVKLALSPVTVPSPVPVPRPVDPVPQQTQTAAPKTAPAPPAPHLASNGPDSWEGRVLMQLSKKRHYPLGAMARHQQGVPYIRFVMDRQGKVLSVNLERSSGVPDLDREALALPKRAQPLPKPPEDRPGDTLELVVPVEFFIH